MFGEHADNADYATRKLSNESKSHVTSEEIDDETYSTHATL